MPRTLCPSNNNDNNKDDNAQILVSVLNPLSPKKAATEEPVEEQTQPTITLEVSPFVIILHISTFISNSLGEVWGWVEKLGFNYDQVPGLTFPSDDTEYSGNHTWYLSRTPRTCLCKFFLAGVNFYRFNAKNWQFTVYFAVITQKNWQFSVYFVVIYAFFWCKFYSPKILLV